ncbi:MAG: hypothetical protein AAB590_01030 [Patescibacteria group bacterium]
MRDLTKVDMSGISKNGQKIYAKLSKEYKRKNKGKYIAVNVKNGEIFKADRTAEAVQKALKKYPNEVFYAVRVGYSVVETLGSFGVRIE